MNNFVIVSEEKFQYHDEKLKFNRKYFLISYSKVYKNRFEPKRFIVSRNCKNYLTPALFCTNKPDIKQ